MPSPAKSSAKQQAQEARLREDYIIKMDAKKLKDVLSRQIAAVSSLFQMWDRDGSGSLTGSEFAEAVGALGIGALHPVAIARVFREFDPSGDGTVTYSEFLRYAFRDSLASSATRVMDFFRDMDVDESGQIGLEEFRKATHSLGFDVPHDDLNAIFADMDSDGSGQISFQELHRQLRQGASITLSRTPMPRWPAGRS